MTNTAKLKAKIAELGLLQEAVAMQLGMTSATFNYKLNNKTEFKASEIKKLAKILHLTVEEVFDIFFAEDVDL
jgi:transcriptional regulator with XRE-family HTH domain